MRLAFVHADYCWYRGFSRDFLRIAKECQRRNHEVCFFTYSWEGEQPEGIEVNLLKSPMLRTNTMKAINLAAQLKHIVRAHRVNGVIGTIKIPGLDVIYDPGTCHAAHYQERNYGRWRDWLPHNRRKKAFERLVFAPESNTTAMCLTASHAHGFLRYYGTQERRLKILPALLDPNRWPPIGLNRVEIRRKLGGGGIHPDARILLFAGSNYKGKGLDRAILALSSLDDRLRKNTNLYVVGNDKHQVKFKRLAKRLNVSANVHMLGNPDNLPELMVASDILVHPAYMESGANVMVESIVSGLPVLATDICGFAYHVRDSGAGKLISSPFDQENMNSILEHMLCSGELERMSQNGLAYGTDPGLYRFPEAAADIIEAAIEQKSDMKGFAVTPSSDI